MYQKCTTWQPVFMILIIIPGWLEFNLNLLFTALGQVPVVIHLLFVLFQPINESSMESLEFFIGQLQLYWEFYESSELACMDILFVVKETATKYNQSDIHEPKSPGLGCKTYVIVSGIRDYSNKPRRDIFHCSHSFHANLLPNLWHYLVSSTFSIQAFKLSCPVLNKCGNNILKK